MSSVPIAERLRKLDWDALAGRLDSDGYALTKPLLSAAECRQLIALFDQDDCFHKTVDMRRVRFGSGVYRYFDYPLPEWVDALRNQCYAPLAQVANTWARQLRQPPDYPDNLVDFLTLCHDHGQTRPTPILFRYGQEDHNALHQDLYGEIAFPFQVVIVLSPPGAYTGGEFVLTTQRPRAQSLVDVINPERGQLLIFPNRYRPVFGKGKGRYYKTSIRHGVSRLHSGERYSLGLIFHDAQ